MQRVKPFLWFNDQAEEAVKFYTSLFENSKTFKIFRYDSAGSDVSGRPKDSVMSINFQLAGQEFVALNGGPQFTFSPAISFFVYCKSTQEIDTLWEQLVQSGTVLMELKKYPFSEKYGFLTDRFGVSWQLILSDRSEKQKIVPSLLFVNKQFGKAEKAIQFYSSVFKDSRIHVIHRYGPGEGQTEGSVAHAVFELLGQNFIAMESSLQHEFTFSLGTSFVVDCKNQEEVDYYWEKLAQGGQTSQCGWLEDQFGVSWQVVPTILEKLMEDPNPAKSEQVMQAMLKMTKLDIHLLEQAAKK
jgi:predicted 3-demethylubiquinone-9 3-methyltransferase (glyoxalase superfamily)